MDSLIILLLRYRTEEYFGRRVFALKTENKREKGKDRKRNSEMAFQKCNLQPWLTWIMR